jgi:two-component system OmpR family sensor kinase
VRLRTTLTFGILVATLAMFLAVGYVAIPEGKRALRDRIDDRVRAALPVARDAVLATRDPSAVELGGALGGREHAVILIDRGRATVLAASGLPGNADPPPDLSGVRDLAGPTEVAYAQAADGTKYRYATIGLGEGRRLAVAAPVGHLRALVDELIRTFSLIGIAGGGALALVSWWWIRRSTRPIERLTERADAIATGDPDRSLSVPASTAELRRLAHALDAMLSDIDAALAARRQSEARLREFVADASHELRTPLTSISGYLQLDLDGALRDDDQHRRAMGRALAEATRMWRIVSDLQVLTELDEDLVPVMGRVELNGLVRDAVNDLAAIDPSHDWIVDLADDAVVVLADPDQLRRVITNLLSNVRTHTPAGTVTTVAAEASADAVVVEVTDNGPGVPADELSRIFDRFWRHDVSRTRSSGGSGLGLAIVDSIVRAHGGTVSAALPDVGGLKIRISLPVAHPVGEVGLTADQATR